MNLHIISPNGTVLETETDFLKLPGQEGQFTVLDGHAPLIAALTKGAIIYKHDGVDKNMEIESGFVEIADDDVKICIY